MIILALDLGTRTGWAAWNGHRIESGVQSFDLERGESPGMRFIRFNRWLEEMQAHLAPELVVYEKAHHRGGHATHLLVNLVGRVEEFCARYGIEHAGVHTGTLKKFATGSGSASKELMVQRARFMFPALAPIDDDNQADALWVLEWARQHFSEAGGGGGSAPIRGS